MNKNILEVIYKGENKHLILGYLFLCQKLFSITQGVQSILLLLSRVFNGIWKNTYEGFILSQPKQYCSPRKK